MIPQIPLIIATVVALVVAKPIEVRTVAALNTAAFEEAQQRDDTATRAFSNTEILTSDGQCLFVDELSGDFRANLNAIQVAKCDGSQGQQWDVITAGKHDDQAGTMLLVNALTQGCMNFDPRRKAGNTVIMFSCGGRADGGGAVTNSQLFNFTGGTGPLALAPLNAVGTCLAVTSGNALDSAACASDASQAFTIGGGKAASAPASTTTAIAASTTAQAISSAASAIAATTSSSSCTSTTIITMTRSASVIPIAASTSAPSITASNSTSISPSSVSSATAISSAPAQDGAVTNPTSAVPVSRAGGVLNPSAAAESQPLDTTAIRAFTSSTILDSTGLCLTISPTTGDFRQNLIPLTFTTCFSSSPGQKFDFITKGIHNDRANSTLVVSSLTNGCLNFDSRRAAGDQVLLFSCGGRADGGGKVTDSQLFAFGGGDSLTLEPASGDPKGSVCLVNNGGKLDQAACDGSAGQVFKVV